MVTFQIDKGTNKATTTTTTLGPPPLTSDEDVVGEESYPKFSDEIQTPSPAKTSNNANRSTSSLRQRLNASMMPPLTPASRAYDRGNKGYLDDVEQLVRAYDEDSDGKISKEEVFKIVEDLEVQRKRKKKYKKGMWGLSITSVVLLLCVFGLMFATVTLTRKLNVGDEDTLVSDSSGRVLKTGRYIPRLTLEMTEEEKEQSLRIDHVDVDNNTNDSNTDSDNNLFATRKLELQEQQHHQDIHQRRHLAVFDTYAGLNYLGRTPKSRFNNLLNQASNGGYKEATLSLATGLDLDICILHSKVKVVDESDELGGKRYVGIQKQGIMGPGTCDSSTHYLFSCGGTDYVDRCYVYEVLAPVAKVGGTTQNQAKITFRIPYNNAQVSVRYNKVNNFNVGYTETNPITVVEDNDYTGTITLSNLDLGDYGSAQTYYYRLVVDGDEYTPINYDQKFQTFPGRSDSDPNNNMAQHLVDIAIYADSAVAKTGENSEAYMNCPSHATLALQIGDLDHSDNIGQLDQTADLTDRKSHYLSLLREMHRNQISQIYPQGVQFVENVLSQRTFAHVWDDHDYCGNDTDGRCEYKDVARKAFEEYYTGYDLPNYDDGIYHKISLGDVDIFMLDTRSQRTPNNEPDDSSKSVLGPTQKAWLKTELANSDSKWKIIVSSISANKYTRPGNTDHWISFQTEAAELKAFLATTDSANDGAPLSERTVMVTGDLHTGGGIDDGCNNRLGIPEIGIPHTNLYSGGNTDFVGIWSEVIRDGNERTSIGDYVGGFGHISATSNELMLRIKHLVQEETTLLMGNFMVKMLNIPVNSLCLLITMMALSQI